LTAGIKFCPNLLSVFVSKSRSSIIVPDRQPTTATVPVPCSVAFGLL